MRLSTLLATAVLAVPALLMPTTTAVDPPRGPRRPTIRAGSWMVGLVGGMIVAAALPAPVTAGPQTVPAAGDWIVDPFDLDTLGLGVWATVEYNGGNATVASGELRLFARPIDASKPASASVARSSSAQAIVHDALGMWPPQELAGVMLETTVKAVRPTALFAAMSGPGFAALEAQAGGVYLLRRGPTDGTVAYTKFAPAPSPGHTYTLRLILRPDHSLTGTVVENGLVLGSATVAASFGPSDVWGANIGAVTGPINGWGSQTAEYLVEDIAVVPSLLEALPPPLLP